MPRPRKRQTGLPSYCYRDRNGRLYMLHPAGRKNDGSLRLRRVTYADLDALLAAWRVTWGEAAQEGGQTVGALLDAFLAGLGERVKRGELSATTKADYSRCVMGLRPVWAAVRIEDVDVPMLYRWRDARGEQSRTRANRERTVLVEAFKPAVRDGRMRDNPVRFLEPFTEKPRTRYVTDAEFMAVYALAAPVVQAAMLLAAVTGLRQGDILRLRRSDFGDDGLRVQTRKTGKGLAFGWSEGLRRAVLVAVGARAFVPMHLIATETGKPYTSDGFRSLWHKAMTAAREAHPTMPRWTFNDLRAKAGSESIDWRILGHLDQRTFERIYNRLPRKVAPTR
jgi:integrase